MVRDGEIDDSESLAALLARAIGWGRLGATLAPLGRRATQALGEPLGGGEHGGRVHPPGLAREPLERARHRHGREDLAAGGANRRRHRRDALLALADRLRPTAPADARQRGGGERGVLEPAVHALGVLPGQQHLGGRARAHGELGADGDGVAQAGRALGSGDADPVVALSSPQLRGLAGDVAQPRENRPSCREQPVLAGGGGQLREARAEDEPPLHVAGDQAVVLQGHGQPVGGRAREAGAGDQAGQGGRAGLQGREHERGLVENADTGSIVHIPILSSQIMGRKR